MLCCIRIFIVRIQFFFVFNCLLLEEGEFECFCGFYFNIDNRDIVMLKNVVKQENCMIRWDLVRDDIGQRSCLFLYIFYL